MEDMITAEPILLVIKVLLIMNGKLLTVDSIQMMTRVIRLYVNAF